MSKMTDWIEKTKRECRPMQVGEDHVPTAGERNNLCYLSMKYIVGWQMRACDFALVDMMGVESSTTMAGLRDGYCNVLADYIWDHLLAEPEEPTADEIAHACRAMVGLLYSLDEEARNLTDAE